LFYLLARNYEWRTKRKLEARFRRNVQFFAFSHDLYRRRTATADTGSDRGAFSTTGDCADDCANTSSRCSALRRLSAAAFSDFLIFRRRDGIRDSVHDDLRQFQTQLRRPRDSSGVVNVSNATAHISALRNDFNAALRHGFIQNGDELITNFVFLAV